MWLKKSLLLISVFVCWGFSMYSKDCCVHSDCDAGDICSTKTDVNPLCLAGLAGKGSCFSGCWTDKNCPSKNTCYGATKDTHGECKKICSKDSDCKNNSDGSRCVTTEFSKGKKICGCENAGQCTAGKVCKNGQCQWCHLLKSDCDTNADCCNGLSCATFSRVSRRCLKNPGQRCSGDDECYFEHYSDDVRCVQGECRVLSD